MLNNPSSKTSPDLYRLIYYSQVTATGMLDLHMVKGIVQESVKNNAVHHITGILSYSNGYFLQYVEGSEQALTNLKNSLLNDTRHQKMKIVDFSLIPNRHFSDWALNEWNIDKESLNDSVINKILPFNPSQWDNNKLNYFIALLKARYDQRKFDETNNKEATNVNNPPIYRTLGLAVGKVVTRHQAFFIVQAIMGMLIALAIILIFFVSQSH